MKKLLESVGLADLGGRVFASSSKKKQTKSSNKNKSTSWKEDDEAVVPELIHNSFTSTTTYGDSLTSFGGDADWGAAEHQALDDQHDKDELPSTSADQEQEFSIAPSDFASLDTFSIADVSCDSKILQKTRQQVQKYSKEPEKFSNEEAAWWCSASSLNASFQDIHLDGDGFLPSSPIMNKRESLLMTPQQTADFSSTVDQR